MNYQRIYFEFIEDRKSKGIDKSYYFENHHILPRSLGGDDSDENLIPLSASDHFFAHLLLAKIYGGKMSTALFFMAGDNSRSAHGYRAKRWAYEFAKKAMADQKRKLVGELSPAYGRKRSDETKRKISKNRSGKMVGPAHFAYGVPSPLRGTTISEEAKLKISLANAGSKNGMFGKTGKLSPSYKKTIFEFTNKNTGDVFIGTQGELIEEYGLCFKNVSAVVTGKRKTVMGWQMSGVIE